MNKQTIYIKHPVTHTSCYLPYKYPIATNPTGKRSPPMKKITEPLPECFMTESDIHYLFLYLQTHGYKLNTRLNKILMTSNNMINSDGKQIVGYFSTIN